MTRTSIEWWAKAEKAGIPIENLVQHWLRDWIHLPKRGGLLTQIVFSMAELPLVVLLYLLILSMKQKGRQGKFQFIQNSQSTGLLWVLLSSVAGLLFGFLTAPDPRFWWGSLITLMILLPLAT